MPFRRPSVNRILKLKNSHGFLLNSNFSRLDGHLYYSIINSITKKLLKRKKKNSLIQRFKIPYLQPNDNEFLYVKTEVAL